MYLLRGFTTLQKKFGNAVSSYALKLPYYIRGGCEQYDRALYSVISCGFRRNKTTFFPPEQSEKVAIPTRQLLGYAPGRGTGRLTEVAMIAFRPEILQPYVRYPPVYLSARPSLLLLLMH